MNRLRLGKSFVYAMSIFIMSVSVFIIGCARDGGNDGDTQRDSDKKIKIVATLFPQYDFARQIAGDYALDVAKPGVKWADVHFSVCRRGYGSYQDQAASPTLHFGKMDLEYLSDAPG